MSGPEQDGRLEPAQSPLSGVSTAPADAALFEQFEECVRRSGVRIHVCRPGLSDDAIDSLMAPTGLRLPDEVRALWRSHDGFDPLPGLDRFESLEDTLAYRASLRRGAEEIEPDYDGLVTADDLWNPQWLPLTVNKSTPVCDCSVGPGRPTPIRMYETATPVEDLRAIYAVSLGQLVRWMIVAIEREWVAPHESGAFVEGPGLAEIYDLPEYSSLCAFI